MARFKAGDSVLINSGLIAEIAYWPENDDGPFTYTFQLSRGGTNTTTAHTSNTRVEPNPTLPIEAEALAAVEAEAVDE